MKEENTHFYTHTCTLEATTTRHAQINRHKHTGKKHKPFGTAPLSREGFKAHWHEFMITALCLCQTSTVVVFSHSHPIFLYALPSPWSELWKMQAGVPQSPLEGCVLECMCACVLGVLRMQHPLLLFPYSKSSSALHYFSNSIFVSRSLQCFNSKTVWFSSHRVALLCFRRTTVINMTFFSIHPFPFDSVCRWGLCELYRGVQSAGPFGPLLDASVPCWWKSGGGHRLPQQYVCTGRDGDGTWDRDLRDRQSQRQENVLYFWQGEAWSHHPGCQCQALLESKTCPQSIASGGALSLEQSYQGLLRNPSLLFDQRSGRRGWRQSSSGQLLRPLRASRWSVSVTYQTKQRPRGLPTFAPLRPSGQGARRGPVQDQSGGSRWNGARPGADGARFKPRWNGRWPGGEGHRQTIAGLQRKWGHWHAQKVTHMTTVEGNKESVFFGFSGNSHAKTVTKTSFKCSLASIIGAVFTVFVVEKYRHWTDV